LVFFQPIFQSFSRSVAPQRNACLDALRRFFNLIYGIFFATGRGASKPAFLCGATERENLVSVKKIDFELLQNELSTHQSRWRTI